MTVEVSWASGAVIMALGAHAIMITRAFTKVEAKLDSMTQSLTRIDRELEKRDTQITSLWKRVDELRDMIKQ